MRLLQVRLALKIDDREQIRQELEAVHDALRDVDVPALEAEAAGLEGDFRYRDGSFKQAAEAFDRQAALLRKEQRYPAMALSLGRAGEAYRKDGASCRSLDRFFRSGRSLFAQGDTSGSLEMIQSAMEAAVDCDQELPREQVRELFNEIRDVVKFNSPHPTPPPGDRLD